jgi:peptidoglycan/xylan/chitin deacetylase (PgdA/CDA1 family)
VRRVKDFARGAAAEVAAGVSPFLWKLRAPGSLVVLMYHRVLPAYSIERRMEQPGMYVSPTTLDMHLSELRRHFELVHLDDWLRRARQGAALPKRACAITFDDGWRDNYEFALPVLVKHGAPASIFLVSRLIGSGERFWPNRLMSLLDRSFVVPGSVSFPEPLRRIVEPILAEARRRGALRAEDGDLAVQAAKELQEERIRELICTAEEGSRRAAEKRELLNAEEVTLLVSSGLVRFGSHTATHFRVGGTVAADDLEREIVLSRRELQEICGQPVDLFCYPNGETSRAAIDMARRNYLGAVTTRKGWHAPSQDAHLIARIGVHEDVSSTPQAFLSRVSGWL